MSLKSIQAFTHYYGHTNNERLFRYLLERDVACFARSSENNKTGLVGKKSLQNWLYKAPPRENTQTPPPYHLKFEIRRYWIVLRLFLRRELLHTVFTSVCRCIIYRYIKCILNQVMLVFVDQCGTLNYWHL